VSERHFVLAEHDAKLAHPLRVPGDVGVLVVTRGVL
jgi:hypothetical protein